MVTSTSAVVHPLSIARGGSQKLGFLHSALVSSPPARPAATGKRAAEKGHLCYTLAGIIDERACGLASILPMASCGEIVLARVPTRDLSRSAEEALGAEISLSLVSQHVQDVEAAEEAFNARPLGTVMVSGHRSGNIFPESSDWWFPCSPCRTHTYP